MGRMLKWAGVGTVVLLVAAQLIRPEKTNPAVHEERTIQANLVVTPEVGAIFGRACQDCRSYSTQWPRYSDVAPVSWFVVGHVNHGRQHLNFSDWMQANLHGQRKDVAEKLEAICKEVSSGGMPLASYAFLHGEARITREDARTVCEWAKTEQQRLARITPAGSPAQ